MSFKLSHTLKSAFGGMVLAGLMAGSAFATPLNLDADGVAVKGYDVISYFTDGKPMKGDKMHKAMHDGATYYFSSAANKEKFEKSPASYIPAYGGWCAIGTANGLKVDIQPKNWKIVDDTLYLNTTPGAHKYWLKSIPKFVKLADKKWPEIKNISQADLKN